MTWIALHIGLSLPGLALCRFLLTHPKPSFLRTLQIPEVVVDSITVNSDHRGLI